MSQQYGAVLEDISIIGNMDPEIQGVAWQNARDRLRPRSGIPESLIPEDLDEAISANAKARQLIEQTARTNELEQEQFETNMAAMQASVVESERTVATAPGTEAAINAQNQDVVRW